MSKTGIGTIKNFEAKAAEHGANKTPIKIVNYLSKSILQVIQQNENIPQNWRIVDCW